MELSDLLKGAAVGAGIVSLPLGFYLYHLKKQMSSRDKEMEKLKADSEEAKAESEEAYARRGTAIIRANRDGQISDVLGGKDWNINVRPGSAYGTKISDFISDIPELARDPEAAKCAIEAFERYQKTGEKVIIQYTSKDLTKPFSCDIEIIPKSKKGSEFGELHISKKDKYEIRARLEAALGKNVADFILSNPSKTSDKKIITILYTDLREFTPWMERNDTDQVVEMLDDHLTLMMDIGEKYHATHDKNIGDSAMLLINAPNNISDHPLVAFDMACEMLDAHNKEWIPKYRAKGWETREMGIGITTGVVMVGIIAGRRKIDFTALGTPVNVASRLVGVAQANEVLMDKLSYDFLDQQKKAQCTKKEGVKLKGIGSEIEIFSHVRNYQ